MPAVRLIPPAGYCCLRCGTGKELPEERPVPPPRGQGLDFPAPLDLTVGPAARPVAGQSCLAAAGGGPAAGRPGPAGRSRAVSASRGLSFAPRSAANTVLAAQMRDRLGARARARASALSSGNSNGSPAGGSVGEF